MHSNLQTFLIAMSLLLSPLAFSSECPTVLNVQVLCSQPGDSLSFQFIKHKGIYLHQPRQPRAPSNLQSDTVYSHTCSYQIPEDEEFQNSSSLHTLWNSTYSIDGILMENVSNVETLQHFVRSMDSQVFYKRDIQPVSQPFLKFTQGMSLVDPDLSSLTLFTGFEFLMTKSEIQGCEFSRQSNRVLEPFGSMRSSYDDLDRTCQSPNLQDLVVGVQLDYSSPFVDPSKFFITGTQCTLQISSLN